MGSTEEINAYMELNARTMIESLLVMAPVISRQRETEVRKYKDFLALLSEKRFVLWRQISGDHRKQAEEMMSQFVGVKRNRIIMS
jgi:hypothetical protein